MEAPTVTRPSGIKDRLALVIATGFGVGYCPIAPGTVGSFVGILLILLLSRWELLGGQWVFVNWLVVAVIGAVGIWAGSRAEAVLGKRDPPQVVIDEIVGQLLTFGLIFRNPPFTLLFLGFLFFRFFDIAKPFPIRSLERVPLGFGIVLDDLAAGFYASLLLALIVRYWPSLA